ncbi:hypothetical protein UFOVP19_16 [uncultured Caudovirales phage]|uniref:Holin n=1 Tax=uncultured Caudovirales phage TaxID=2100421 RepID=A0A6J5KJQ1_9CAUD|nr:hypothetical protein UFOVP19_16 [uncultured Caudovirales phage]
MMKFLNSIYGSWVKIFTSAILTMIIAKGDIYAVTLKECISAGIISILPIIINYLNPNDTRYGK